MKEARRPAPWPRKSVTKPAKPLAGKIFAWRSLRPVGVAAALVCALPACSRINYQRGYLADPAMMAAVAPGVDNRDSVEKMLGRPSLASEFDDTTWYYVSQKAEQFAFFTPKPVEHKVVAIRFNDKGDVTAIDNFGLDDIVDITPHSDKTATRGKEITFLQQLFGNVGRFGAAPAAPRGGAGGQN
ncbi:MAG: outer membrane protein assembly factor BamE [Alphaproteobacteria bacterium]|nr:MAG: outer membrane protein assembly factor BamE [Alphaproteobacteria bacterium]